MDICSAAEAGEGEEEAKGEEEEEKELTPEEKARQELKAEIKVGSVGHGQRCIGVC